MGGLLCLLFRRHHQLQCRLVQLFPGEQLLVVDQQGPVVRTFGRTIRSLYLGATLTDSVDNHTEVIRRIGSVNAMASQLQLFWSKAGTTVKWRLRMFEAALSSKLLYGLETTQLTKSELNSIDAFQMKMLRKILRVPSTYIDRAWTNQRIIEHLSQQFGYRHQSLEQMETKQNSPVRAHSPCAPS